MRSAVSLALLFCQQDFEPLIKKSKTDLESWPKEAQPTMPSMILRAILEIILTGERKRGREGVHMAYVKGTEEEDFEETLTLEPFYVPKTTVRHDSRP